MLLYYLKILFISVVAGIVFVFSRYIIYKIFNRDLEYSVFKRLAFVISIAFIIFVAYSLENGKLEGIDKMFSAEVDSPPNKARNFFSLGSDIQSLSEVINGDNVIKRKNLDCTWILDISTRAFYIDSQETQSGEYYVRLNTKCNYPINDASYMVDSISISYEDDSVTYWLRIDTTMTSYWRIDMNVPSTTIFENIDIPDEKEKISISFIAYSDSTNSTLDDTLVFKIDLYKRSNSW